mgnify:CR=1 FL=1
MVRRFLLRRIQRQTAAAKPYLPVWLVAPRAWAQRSVSQPRFDGSGRLLLQELHLELEQLCCPRLLNQW